APVGTTAINVVWNTNINANCTYGGVTANANGGTTGHFVTRSSLFNGFSDTQTIVCSDVASSSNSASLQVTVSVQNPAITISGLSFTNQNGTAITMPAPVGTTAINVVWNTNINANCTYGGVTANANGGTTGHFVTRSSLFNGFSDTQTIVCSDVASSSNSASLQVTVSVQNPQIAISGLSFTNQNGTAITIPAPVGTTAINVVWNTNINANCTYSGVTANANGGTTGHFVTRSSLFNGFSDTQTIVCSDVASSSNTASLQVTVAVQNPPITISGLSFTNQNGTAITMPAPVGTTAINVVWNTNINANCTYGGVTANANGGTTGHFVTRSSLFNGFRDTQTIVCTDLASSSNSASLQVTVAVQNPAITISGLSFTNQNGTAISMPAAPGTTAINVVWNTNINANCTYGGITANANGGTTGHFVTRSSLFNGFNDTQTIVCTDVASSSNSASLQVTVAVQNPAITISGLSFTNQNGTAISMPAAAGTTAINVVWNTNINANCTYGGITANANGGTTGHFVTRSSLFNGFSDTQTIVCSDVSNASNSTSIQVTVSVQNSPIAISGLHFTNQNGAAINMPAPAGTTAINVVWNTNINANCTYGGFTANANGGASGHFVTRSSLFNGFSDTQTIVCSDVSNTSNSTSLQVTVSVQNSPIFISGLSFTNQNGAAISMPAPAGTTAINVVWNTNINANCTYGGFTANANGGTNGHFVTRSSLFNGFSDTQTIVCSDVSNSSNSTSLQVTVSVQNPPPISISGIRFTNQNGFSVSMPAPAGTTAINVVWDTNVNANCTYGGFTANANGGTTGHFVTRSPLFNGFSDTQTIVCTDVNNSSNTTSVSVSIAVSN
ncbi:MAG TPA: hypothetical protein VHA33_08445, partial [Candidatus Angelobacter sp.]|nr:hypothetical protein [Candidatus Angelobacter sp.]